MTEDTRDTNKPRSSDIEKLTGDISDLATHRRDVSSAMRETTADIAKKSDQTRQAREQMLVISRISGSDYTMKRITDQIGLQRKEIDSIIPSVDIIKYDSRSLQPPPDPLRDTNDRLARMEKVIINMQAILTRSTSIATDLQTAAADFLVKFERAAGDNNKSSKRGLLIGKIAIIIAIVPVAHIFYSEFWRVPKDAEAMQTVVNDMKAEIADLRDAQARAADRLSKVLEKSDDEVADVLRDILDLLAKQQSIIPQPAPPSP